MKTLAEIRTTLNSIRDNNTRKVLANLIDVLLETGLEKHLREVRLMGKAKEVAKQPEPKKEVVEKVEVKATLPEVKAKPKKKRSRKAEAKK